MSRRFVRFSLMSFALLAALISVSVSHVNVTLKNRKLGDENRQLKKELGYITIDDATKAYVVQVPVPQPRTWQFRVYLPPNHTYVLCHKSTGRGGGVGLGNIVGSQFTLTICLQQMTNGAWGLYGNWYSTSQSHGGGMQIVADVPDSMMDPQFASSLLGQEQRECDPDGKISLIRFRDEFNVWIEDSKGGERNGHKLVPPLPNAEPERDRDISPGSGQ